MSSVIKIFTVFFLIIPTVRSTGELLGLKCQPAVGIVSQTTVIKCEYKGKRDAKISAAALSKFPEGKEIFTMENGKISGDQRFSLENVAGGHSLKITDTMLSDKGHYEYQVETDSGGQTVEITISVTAKYKDPITSTWPKNVNEGEPVDLYCNATDGYPAGSIHWTDRYETDWTPNSVLTKVTKSQSVTLSSKLSFKSFNSGFAPFRCIVLNSNKEQDGESTLKITSFRSNAPVDEVKPETTKIIAGVMVIGSLIVGLLFALLFFRRRNSYKGRRPSTHPFLNNEAGNNPEDYVEAPQKEQQD